MIATGYERILEDPRTLTEDPTNRYIAHVQRELILWQHLREQMDTIKGPLTPQALTQEAYHRCQYYVELWDIFDECSHFFTLKQNLRIRLYLRHISNLMRYTTRYVPDINRLLEDKDE